MSAIGRGKTAEAVYVQNMFLPERIVAATTYYNGYSATTTAVMIDTQDYDDVVFALSIGTVLGATTSVANAIYESATNNPMAATALTSASFTAATSSADETVQVASVKCKDTKRYLCLVTTSTGEPMTVDMSAIAVLSRTKAQATANTLVFDL